MSTSTQVTPNGRSIAPADVKEIQVAYNGTSSVTVLPDSVSKGTTARFKDPRGGKLRIVFLSPTGKATDQVLDSELCTLTVGGMYHFKCFFTDKDGVERESPADGGVIEVSPVRP
jgi:hypothetical protein